MLKVFESETLKPSDAILDSERRLVSCLVELSAARAHGRGVGPRAVAPRKVVGDVLGGLHQLKLRGRAARVGTREELHIVVEEGGRLDAARVVGRRGAAAVG